MATVSWGRKICYFMEENITNGIQDRAQFLPEVEKVSMDFEMTAGTPAWVDDRYANFGANACHGKLSSAKYQDRNFSGSWNFCVATFDAMELSRGFDEHFYEGSGAVSKMGGNRFNLFTPPRH